MKRFLKLKYFLIGGIGIFLVVLGLEFQDIYRKNGNFRTMQDPLTLTEFVDLTGLRELQFTGGPPIPLTELKKRLAHLQGAKIIVDGIYGKYGYIHGVPESYFAYNQGSPSWKNYVWRLFYTGTVKSYPEDIIPAAEAAKEYGFGYKSFHIESKYLSHHKDISIDDFVSFVNSLPENVCLYFHCIHGKGRTSMMLVMADIIKNAPTVALKDIIKRQHLLGSVDLFDTTPWTRSTYSTKLLEIRKKFIEDFYEFICQRKAGGIQLWSEWNRHTNSHSSNEGVRLRTRSAHVFEYAPRSSPCFPTHCLNAKWYSEESGINILVLLEKIYEKIL